MLLHAVFLIGLAPPDDARRGEFFEAHIRPIFATHCVGCHGPTKQKGGLRLDLKAAAMGGGETGPALVPGRTDQGELLRAVRYEPDGYRMPPKGKLSAEKIADLERWVRDGAYWPEETKASTTSSSEANWLEARRKSHWCWQRPRSTAAPIVKNSSWPTNDVDRYLLAKMEAAGVGPANDADRATVLRRVHAVLTGLPPTPEEIDAFVHDAEPAALERVVDRLLASAAFGERWGRHWLDLVRYSETLGHEFDFDIPNAWRYRDYVIRAFNADLTFDRFVVENVAGDLMPTPRLDPRGQRNESVIGPGFWFFGEGKQAPVDVRSEQADHVDNQIDVFGKTFLGLTVACARCHDHKFDAISTRDYYALYGFVKSTRYTQASTVPVSRWREEVAARSRVEQEIRRLVASEWKDQVRQWAEATAKKATTASQRCEGDADGGRTAGKVRVLGDAREGFKGWRRNGPATMLAECQIGDPVLGDSAAEPIVRLFERETFCTSRWSKRFQGTLRSPTFIIDQPNLLVRASGKRARLNVVIENFEIIREPIYGGLKVRLDGGETKWSRVNLAAWMGREAYVELLDQTAADLGDPDHSEYPADSWFSVDEVLLSEAATPPTAARNQGAPKRERRAGDESLFNDGSIASRGLDDVKRRAVDAVERWRVGSPMSPEDAGLLNGLIKERLLTGPSGERKKSLEALFAERARLDEATPDYAATPTADDGDGHDEAVFVRGNAKKLGPSVPRRFLEALGGEELTKNRDGSGRMWLAKRLIDRENPLVARVAVNRIWRHVFGRGLVESPDNFGSLGEAPTHLELLDHLAIQFVRDGWSTKRLVRTLVLSRAFGLSSKVTNEARNKDPENKLFARADVRRLDAESIRDALLTASGGSQVMFGPGVLVHLDDFSEGRGKPRSGPLDGDRRRAIYLAVRRNFPLSMLAAFDAPSPASPVGKRTVSNVPAQALILLNDPFVVHQAKATAQVLLSSTPNFVEFRIRRLYLTAYGRAPSADEISAAVQFVRERSAGKGPSGTNFDDAAAWADLCHAVFNSKEFIFLR